MRNFKKGDKVVVLRTNTNDKVKAGEFLTILEDDSNIPFVQKADGEKTVVSASNLRLAKIDYQNFTVGDVLIDEDEESKVLAKVGEIFAKSTWGSPDVFGAWYHISAIEDNGWKFKQITPDDDVQEMTVEQVSKLVGKKVKIIE